MSQSQVQCIVQDKDGFLWIGTSGGGLNRFDGRNFITYSTFDGMPDDFIWSLFCDSKNRLWIGTANGLAMMQDGKIKKFPSYNGLDDGAIWNISEDLQGRIWVATSSYGVGMYDGTKFTMFSIRDGLGFNSVNRIFSDSKGRVWIGSYGYGMSLYENNELTHYSSAKGFEGEAIYSIEEDSTGRILFFTDRGLLTYNGRYFGEMDIPGIDFTRVTGSYIDKENYLWICTNQDGVFKIRKDYFRHYYHDNGLPSDYVNCIKGDDQGNIWIGSDGSGFAKFTGEMFVSYDYRNGLNNNVIKAVLRDRWGKVWVGTDKGVNRFRPDDSEEKVQSWMNDKNCQALFEDYMGNIWAGFEGVIGYFDLYRKFHAVPNVPDDLLPLCFYEDGNYDLWAGTDRGVFRITEDRVIHRFRDTLPEENVFAIRKSKTVRNAFWICSNAGLSLFDGKSVKALKIKSPNENLEIVDIWEDPTGKKWVATNKGIIRLDKNGNRKTITTRSGLVSNNLYTMFWFKQSLWIGSDKGLDRLVLNDNYEIEHIVYYGKGQGFSGVESNTLAYVLEEDKFWLGTINGLFIYYPQYDHIKLESPQVRLTDIQLFNQDINWKKEFPNIKFRHQLPVNPVFPYYRNYLSFFYTAIDFNHPEGLRFRYKLVDLDTAWVLGRNENQVSYPNLAPGNYRFMVSASNDGVVWGSPAVFRFVVRAPFWQQTWFYFVSIPFILLLIVFFIWWRTRRLWQAKKKLEEKVAARTLELNEKNIELEKLSIVASQSNEGVLICDNKGNILYLNEGFVRMTGYETNEFSGSEYAKNRLQDLSSKTDIDQLLQQFEKDHIPITYESAHRMKDGKTMWTRASLTPIYDKKNKLSKVIALYSDITDRVITEQALIQSNKDITDSIVYARRIQEAILPNTSILKNSFPDSFLFYRPRDIVCGDFYWFTQIDEHFVWACADCTGHGVPGAMMTMIGNEYLHQIVNKNLVTSPEKVLSQLDERITRSLKQTDEGVQTRDGMDIGICSMDTKTMTARFCGANIPIYVLRNGELVEYASSKYPIGGMMEEKEFHGIEFTFQKGDTFYMCSDGYLDQFGGDEGKKFMRKRWRDLLLSIRAMDMAEQRNTIERIFDEWRGQYPQIDDVLVIGVKI
ncbi:MAG: two-component regulator propeller domain-containing protein [Flavobacteriales bacterium]